MTPTPQTRPVERRVVTVLFTDISGFTSLSETMDPEEVADLLNAFFRLLTAPIYRYGGVVDKYMGDAIMAVFGAPAAHEDDAARALHAAWEMQEAARAFTSRLEERTGIELKVRIGLNTGLVVASEIGGEAKREYTVYGDTVNVAQRMEANAPPGGILLTDETRRLAADAFNFERREPIKVKGRQQPVLCYLLGGLAGLVEQSPVEVVGRDTEIAALEQAWAEVSEGRHRIAVVAGPKGLGKSALLQDFRQRHMADATVLRAAPGSYEAQASMRTASVLARQLVGHGKPVQSEPDLRATIARSWHSRSKDRDAVAALAYLLAEGDGPHSGSLNPSHRQALAFSYLGDLIRDSARWRPVLLAIDNWQWVDGASRNWLAALVAELEREPAAVMIVLSERTSADETPSPAAHVHLDLGRLSEAGAAALLDRELARHGHSPGPEDRKSLLARANGNPAFLLALAESAAHLRDSGKLMAEFGGLPITVVNHLSAHLDGLRLSPLATLALDMMAALGQSAPMDMLCELVSDHIEAVAELLDAGVLAHDEHDFDRVVFCDPLLQEVVYERTTLKRRRETHLAIARYLEERRRNPALVAEHYQLADRPDEAGGFFLLAAERALGAFSQEEAVRLAERALGLLGRAGQIDPAHVARALEIRAQALAAAGRLGGAVEALGERLAFHSDSQSLGKAYEQICGYLLRLGRLPEAVAACDEGLSRCADNRYGLVRLFARRAQARLRMGEVDQAMADCRAALDRLGKNREPALAGFLLYVLGSIEARKADFDAARQAFDHSLAALDEAGDRYLEALAFNDLACVHMRLCRVDAAMNCFERGLELAGRIRDRGLQASIMENLAIVLASQGAEGEALHFTESAAALRAESGDEPSEATLLASGTAVANTAS